MGVVLTENGARKLKQIVAKVEAMKTDRTGAALPSGPFENEMWGFITGCDLSGRRYSFVRVQPDVGADDPDIILDGGVLKYRIFDGDPASASYAAYEANGARGIATGKVVRMTFAGYRDDDGDLVPSFVFQYEHFDPNDMGLPLHDHRDNLHGGFAFATFHPGTSLPQQSWHP